MLERLNPSSTFDDLTRADDSDPNETAEWLDALESVFRVAGGERAEFILPALDRKARDLGVVANVLPFGPYRNTIPLEKQSPFPGDIEMETRITAIIRWNALAMVVRRTRPMANSGAMSPATPPPPRFLRSASIISSAGRTANAAATSSSSSRTRPLASTLALSSKAASPRSA
jgi:hypothetical protein